MMFSTAAVPIQQVRAAENDTTGRVDFDDADLPPANVEIDLSQGMFNDLFGIGDAAVAGIAEALSQSADGSQGTEATQLAAEQLEAARQIFQLAGEVVREVRVRGYEKAPDGLASHFEGKLADGNWETLVRVHKNEENVRISLLRSEGAVRGVFVVAANAGGLFVANVVCDVSPDNVKKLTSAATKIGLENGLAQAIEAKMHKMQHQLPPTEQVPARDNQ
jgi:hypothetical protein